MNAYIVNQAHSCVCAFYVINTTRIESIKRRTYTTIMRDMFFWGGACMRGKLMMKKHVIVALLAGWERQEWTFLLLVQRWSFTRLDHHKKQTNAHFKIINVHSNHLSHLSFLYITQCCKVTSLDLTVIVCCFFLRPSFKKAQPAME